MQQVACSNCKSVCAIPAGSVQVACPTCQTILQVAAAPVAGQPIMVQQQQPLMVQQQAAPQQQVMQGVGCAMLDQFPSLRVSQSKKCCLFEHFCFETESHFRVSTPMNPGLEIFHVKEESSCCCRFCFGTMRSLKMTMSVGTETQVGPAVASFERPFRARAPSCCCHQEMRVTDAADSKVIGKSKIPCFCGGPKVDVYDASDVKIMQIQGPCCACGMPRFDIDKGGAIQKQWGGIVDEFCTDADTFDVTFPPGATPAEKANILGATFLIDYNFFETDKKEGA